MFQRKKILQSFFFIFFYIFSNFSFAEEKSEIDFLLSINDMKADYEQERYDTKDINLSEGKIIVKKPDSVLVTFNDGKMKLKIISINGNVKVIDENIKQTTYIDDYYSELMQFFTKNIKPDKIKKNIYGDLCIPFKRFSDNFIACLKVDKENNTLRKITVFAGTDSDNKQQKRKKIRPIMGINFKNVVINKGVDNSVFHVKDSRIFNNEEI